MRRPIAYTRHGATPIVRRQDAVGDGKLRPGAAT